MNIPVENRAVLKTVDAPEQGNFLNREQSSLAELDNRIVDANIRLHDLLDTLIKPPPTGEISSQCDEPALELGKLEMNERLLTSCHEHISTLHDLLTCLSKTL